jgi:HlyD family secretion protein
VSYSVVIAVGNPDGRLLPAMTATVEFIVARVDDVLKVANAALRFQPTEAMRAAALANRPAPDSAALAARAAGRSGAAAGGTGARAAGGNRAPGAASRSALWLVDENGAPAMVPVQTGLTDGQYTEVRGRSLAEGVQVIAGTTAGATAEAAPNPFQTTQQRGPGGPRF